MRTRELVQVANVERDVATQPRVEIRMDVVEEYATALRAGADVPPIVVFEDAEGRLWLADGWHRLLAHESAELEEAWATVRTGTRRDAILHAAGANADHGLRRSNADKRRAVEMLLRDPEWSAWSDRAIAEACRVTHPFVAQVRQVVTVTTSTERRGIDGKVYPAPGRPPPKRDAETKAFMEDLDRRIEDGTFETGVAGVGQDAAAPTGEGEDRDDARGDRGAARVMEGPSAALPSSDPTEDVELEDEDAEVVVRRPGSTSQAATTARRASAPAVEGAPLIDLRCCSNEAVDWPESDLDVADPPWSYVQRIGASRADNHYACLPIRVIVRHLARMRGARVALWATWPTEAAFRRLWPLRSRTGGVWVKSGAEGVLDVWDPNDFVVADEDRELIDGEDLDGGHYGQGFHWAGCSEPVYVATRRPPYTDRSVALRNAWIERPGEHSEKPVGWMVGWIRRWVPPGGLVCDPYAGLGTVARAVVLAGEGRRYLGTEIDPERHARALELLAEVQGG